MIVIVEAVRTAMGGFQGSLSSCTAPDLGAVAIKEAVARAGLAANDIDEVIMGCVLPAGLKQGPARQAMRQAGLPDSTGATTINKICGSGMKAVMQAADAIKAGSAEIVVAGGMESMSNAPYLMDKARAGFRMGHGKVTDHMFQEGLEDAETGLSMGILAQEMADKKGYTREQQDDYAIGSLNKAVTAVQQGFFKDEIVPVTVSSRKGDVVVEQDEQPLNAKADKIPTLRPAFKKDGTITAANASSISDGASALVITSSEIAAQRNLKPLANIVAYASHSQHPSEFTIAPVGAIEKVLKKTGWNAADVDLWEINEAFAAQVMGCLRAWEDAEYCRTQLNTETLGALDESKLNVDGGAIAIGHPVGASGARIVLHLAHALRAQGKQKGIAAICIGGGQGGALMLEAIAQ